MLTLLKLLLLPPDLLKSHAQAYADLASERTACYLATLKRRCVMYGLSALALLLALMLGGVALMLWGTLPLQGAAFPWALLVVPLACLMLSVVCWWRARSLRLPTVWMDIQTQFQLDIQALKQADTA